MKLQTWRGNNMLLIRSFEDAVELATSNDGNDIEIFDGIVKAFMFWHYDSPNYNFIRNIKGEILIKVNASSYHSIIISTEVVNFIYNVHNIKRGNT